MSPSTQPETPDLTGRVTRVQEGILAAEDILAGRPSPFHIMVSADIAGPVDPARLRAVLGGLTRRHAALRSVYDRDATTGRVVCRVLPEWNPRIVEQELPAQAAHVDPVGLVHGQLAPAVPAMLRPSQQPPVVFVVTRVTPERTVLSLVAHHVVLDGWSIGLLWEEFAAGYAAGAVDPEPAPGMEVIVAAQDRVLASDKVARRAAMIADWPAVLELPSDLERPAVRTYAGTRLPFRLSDAARTGCERLAETNAVSRNVVLLAAWTLTVSRRTGASRLLVGVPTPGRTTRTQMRVVGGATGLGVIACEVPEDDTTAEFLKRTAAATLDSLRYGGVPLEDLATALRAGVDRSRNPLTQIAFGAHADVVPGVIEAGPIRFEVCIGHTGGTAYDATLSVMAWGEEPRLVIEYATSVLTAAEAMDLVASFERVLEEMAAAPAVADITSVSPAQRRRLDAWADGPAADLPDGLWQLIEATAARRPDAIAVRDDDVVLTYRELVAAAGAWSARLAAAGVVEGDRVALAVSRSAAEIVAIAATLRAGAAYVGIDSDHPPAANADILDAAGVRVVVGEPSRLAALGAVLEGRTPLDISERDLTPAVSTVPASAPADLDRLAYLAFTSGTTGRPKGAEVTCRAVVALAHEPAFLARGASDRFLRLSPLAFDASTLEIFAPLLAGGAVEVFTASHVTASGLARFLRRRRITGLWLSAGLFRLVADFRPTAFRAVVQLLTGGDVVPPTQAATVLRACPGLLLTNGYGPTENTTFTTVHHAGDPAAVAGPSLPIGRPIQGGGVVVLDPAGRLVPPGGVGELFAYGAGLADGYAGRPAETSAAFGRFARGDDRRLYRTGDLVRWDAEGNLRFLGRRDRQVKIRGFRVEPEYIATVLREHPRVSDAAVGVVPVAHGDYQILAALAMAGGTELIEQVRRFAGQRLPSYSLPDLWVAAGEFPVTANGKVDFARLTEAATEAAEVAEAPVQPVPDVAPAAGDLESVIADAWEQVLGHRDFKYSDWFFDVGGDSLSLIRVHTILTHALPDRSIEIADLYVHSAIEDLAAKLLEIPQPAAA